LILQHIMITQNVMRSAMEVSKMPPREEWTGYQEWGQPGGAPQQQWGQPPLPPMPQSKPPQAPQAPQGSGQF
jgi:hypothetical protein